MKFSIKAFVVFLSIVLLASAFCAVAGERPPYNVVLIVSDQHKRSVAGCYGDPMAITPNIDQLAKTGIRFTNFYAPSPLCAPSRAAMVTGVHPYANGVLYHQFSKEVDGRVSKIGPGHFREGYHTDLMTLAEVFKSRGYRTAAIGKMHVHGELQEHVNPDYPEGNDMGFDHSAMRYFTYFPGGHYRDIHGEDVYERYRESGKYKGLNKLNTDKRTTLVEDYEDIFDVSVTAQSAQFIREQAKERKPFFIHVGLEKPHLPWTTSQKYFDLYAGKKFEIPSSAGEWLNNGRFPWISKWVHNPMGVEAPDKARNAIAAYYACVSEVDDMVGRIVKVLKETGTYENTIIIYTTDHGEHLFDKGLIGKHCMYENAAGIPFIVSCPRLFPANQVSNSLASLIDIFPTLCEALGFAKPAQLQGRSLYREMLRGEDVMNVPVYSEYHEGGYVFFPKEKHLPVRMVRAGTLKYVYTHGMVGQLYDLEKDPGELTNLAFDPKYRLQSLQYNLLALDNWKLPEFPLLNAGVVQKSDDRYLRWEAFSEAGHYVILKADEPDPLKAAVIASGVTGTTWKVSRSEKGFFWILAVPDFKQRSERFGNRPVALNTFPQQLPCSQRIAL